MTKNDLETVCMLAERYLDSGQHDAKDNDAFWQALDAVKREYERLRYAPGWALLKVEVNPL